MTFSVDYVLIKPGENRCWSLVEVKGLNILSLVNYGLLFMSLCSSVGRTSSLVCLLGLRFQSCHGSCHVLASAMTVT